jgi:hypothetical protein
MQIVFVDAILRAMRIEGMLEFLQETRVVLIQVVSR